MNPITKDFAVALCHTLSRSFVQNFKQIVSKEKPNTADKINTLCDCMSGYNRIVSSIIIECSDGSTRPITFQEKIMWFYTAGITITNTLDDKYFELYTKFINEWNRNPEMSAKEVFNNIGYSLYE